ncbi:MAG: FAD-binding oxidoreductase [Methylococcales bacterium]|nr:FAD-binding oxidoreductase [Methylococcales bacterium]
MKKVDFLIIGQGLAGSLLGFELIQRGFKVVILDKGVENASQIAAGLINPVTGMRFVKSAEVDFLLPAAQQYYNYLAYFFQQKFYIEKPMLRLLTSSKAHQHAIKRLKNSDYADYLGDIIETTRFNVPILEQKQTGYLQTQILLNTLKQFFIEHDSYQQSTFDYEAIEFRETVSYDSITAQKIIFCEGYLAYKNPWFSKLPFQLAKGEILTLKSPQPLADYLLNYGQWMIPLDGSSFRTGATFDRERINTQLTSKGRHDLLTCLHTVLPETKMATVTKQQANIRPCTLDKQPFIGFHPKYPQLAIFNGFGAKGSLQIPYYCQQFATNLLKKVPLSETIDIKRYSMAWLPI